MHESAGWQFEVEVHPPDWNFPAGKSWLAGWIRPAAGQVLTDVRAQLHHRVILGLFGLPHPAFTEKSPGHPDSCRPGFSFLLTPQPGATLLRLEARDLSGQWTEFFRIRITAATDTLAPSSAPSLSQSLSRLVTDLLRRRMRTSGRAWTDLADNLMAAFVAEPLNAHPNLPFIGALEEPHESGRLRYGLIPVTGWLAHPKAKIARLSAVIDPLPAISLPHGLARKDVAGIFSALGGQANAAFVGEIALPSDLAAPVLLKIFAELDNGERHLAFARRFTPHFHGDTGKMPPLVTGFIFARVIWTLHRSAGRRALPRRGLVRAARAIWASYQAVPAYRPKKILPLLKKIPFGSKDGPSRRDHAGVNSSAGNVPTAGTSVLPASTVIASADDMCVPDASQYFHLGREALTLVQQAVTLAGGGRIEAILDLPCGYGRVARWLRTAYPAARLTMSDTHGPAVAFCVEQLGATGVQAAIDGRHWAALPGPYDIIWCGSLLTHLDRDEWITHLRRFAERLSPHGVLVFTAHGLLALDKLQSGEKDYGLLQPEITRLCASAAAEGFGYVGYPDTPAYGISVAQPAWICELIARQTELHVLDFRVAAWDQHQDVVVCSRRASASRLV
jgi:2-polyprenyl-3-methyl-5-hydroxy-6-metoxy-1,4-benzoquinol methylase